MDDYGLPLFFLAIFVGVVALIFIFDDTKERRAACEAKGGVYVTGRRVSPICVDKKSIIEFEKH